VTWAQPLSPDDAVAVIGGGISGLSCAQVGACTPVGVDSCLLDGQRTPNCSTPTHACLAHHHAQGLVAHGMRAVVFDTGEHGVGGRAATHTTADRSVHADWLSSSDGLQGGAGLLFDHAAQCFTATQPAFKQQCDAWEAAGAGWCVCKLHGWGCLGLEQRNCRR
jgi:predicted NAD/FAD-dependent oxidoreductase